jgi:methionyl-tRNA formyltransferase
MEENKKILILCGGKFAFKTLQLLAHEKFLYAIGIGKGSEMIVDALEREAEDNNMAFQSFPNKKSMSEMKKWIYSIQPDYIFSISFPFLLSEEVLSYGHEKFINFHPGPLPEYRGVMPIFEVLKNQESQTAICAHFMNDHFDKGNIIFNDPVVIDEGDTYGKLTVKLSKRMSHVVLNVANMIQFGSKIPSAIQDESVAYYYEKPQFSDTYINWKKMNASEIVSLVNACNPWNIGADASLMGEQVKIIRATVHSVSHYNTAVGTIIEINEDSINVACLDNEQIAIEIMSTDEGIMTIKQWNIKENLIGKIFN